MIIRAISNRVLSAKGFKHGERSMTSRGLLYLFPCLSSSFLPPRHPLITESFRLYSLLPFTTEPWGRWRSSLIQSIYERCSVLREIYESLPCQVLFYLSPLVLLLLIRLLPFRWWGSSGWWPVTKSIVPFNWKHFSLLIKGLVKQSNRSLQLKAFLSFSSNFIFNQ